LLKSNTEVPYVAEICELYTAKKKKMFRAYWFYRPRDILSEGFQNFAPDEIIYSDHMDCHNLNTIISRCDILPKISNNPLEDYIRKQNPQTLYVCETFYECQTGVKLFLFYQRV
jgi:hypothetical protein